MNDRRRCHKFGVQKEVMVPKEQMSIYFRDNLRLMQTRRNIEIDNSKL